MTTIALVDDHTLIRNALVSLVKQFDDFEVLMDCPNGQVLIKALEAGNLPDIVLTDIQMPVMDGYATVQHITQHFPSIKCLVLTVEDHEESILRMLNAGAVGYLLKDSDPEQLETALDEVVKYGYYHTEFVRNTLVKSLKGSFRQNSGAKIVNPREAEFLRLVCTELTYKEIADQMCLSPRTIDGYRDALFDKLGIKSRVGLVLFAIKHGIHTI